MREAPLPPVPRKPAGLRPPAAPLRSDARVLRARRKWVLITHELNENPFFAAFMDWKAQMRLFRVTITGTTLVEWSCSFRTSTQVRFASRLGFGPPTRVRSPVHTPVPVHWSCHAPSHLLALSAWCVYCFPQQLKSSVYAEPCTQVLCSLPGGFTHCCSPDPVIAQLLCALASMSPRHSPCTLLGATCLALTTASARHRPPAR